MRLGSAGESTSDDPVPADRDSPDRYADDNLLLDAHEDDWAWRRRIRSNPHSHRIYRLTIGTVGAVVVGGGLIMVPFPGPGWLVVFIGVAIWGSEFEWAQRLLNFGKRTLRAWEVWLRRQDWYVQAVVLVVTFVCAAAIVWGVLWLLGVPEIVPDGIREWMAAHLALD